MDNLVFEESITTETDQSEFTEKKMGVCQRQQRTELFIASSD